MSFSFTLQAEYRLLPFAPGEVKKKKNWILICLLQKWFNAPKQHAMPLPFHPFTTLVPCLESPNGITLTPRSVTNLGHYYEVVPRMRLGRPPPQSPFFQRSNHCLRLWPERQSERIRKNEKPVKIISHSKKILHAPYRVVLVHFHWQFGTCVRFASGAESIDNNGPSLYHSFTTLRPSWLKKPLTWFAWIVSSSPSWPEKSNKQRRMTSSGEITWKKETVCQTLTEASRKLHTD